MKTKKMIYVTKEKLRQSAMPPVSELNSADLARSEQATRTAMQVDFPAANLVTFIELEQ